MTPSIGTRARLMVSAPFDALDGAMALESHLALPAAWRGACGPLLLVDVSPVSYIAAFRDGRRAKGKSQGALAVEIALAVRTYIRDMVGDVHPAACVLFFDSPTPTLRSTLLGRYKANRKERNAAYDEEKRALNAARLESLDGMWLAESLRPGCNVARKAGWEADDLIAAFVHALRVAPDGTRLTARQRIMVATNDTDLCQLLDFANVDILDVGKRAYVTRKSFTEREGYGPELIPAVKAIGGDTSDNIPGIAGVGEKTAVKFLKGEPISNERRSLLEMFWGKAEEYYDLTRLPFAGCSLKGMIFDASKDPDDLFTGSGDPMPF